jgi:SAM-dependent methyltransferase
MASPSLSLRMRWRVWLVGTRRSQRWVRRLVYFGKAVECPCCGSRARRYMAEAMPGYKRLKARCPSCFAVERQRALKVFLEGWMANGSELTYLVHQAPDLPLRAWLQERPRVFYIAADLAPIGVDVRYSLESIPFRDASIDVLVASHVLEHVRDDSAALGEIRRVLRPNGSAVFLVPIDSTRQETYEDASLVEPEQRRLAFWQSDHVRLSGFDVEMRRPSQELPQKLVDRYGLTVDPSVYKLAPIAPPDEIYVASPSISPS